MTRTKVPPRTFREFVDGLPKKYLECRADGHHFKHFTAKHDEVNHCYDRRLKCPTCQTIKSQILDEEGYIIRAGRYSYPEGFLATNVEMPLTRSEANAVCRLALTKRDLERAA